MDLTALPDIAGMLVLMGVLAWLRRRLHDVEVDLWLLGLFFILLEAVAVALLRVDGALYRATHVVALDAYMLAGATFGWAARRDLLPGRSHLPFFALPAVPMFLLSTLYGLGVTDVRPFAVLAGVSLLLGFGYIAVVLRGTLRLRATLLAIHGVIWIPALTLALHGRLRGLVYWELACLYLLVAFSFRSRVRRGSVGGLVIVAGFAVWALCFCLHPLVRNHVPYDGVVEQVRNVQKFFVILGMLLTLLEDETERRKQEATLDALTGLPNRRLFDDRLSQALERALRSGKSLALFVVDLNGFKLVNDTLGHREGDRVLQAVAQALGTKVRSSDTLARCGGDEFCVIVNELTRREDCVRITEALCDAVSDVELAAGGGLSLSVGFALFPDDAASGDALYQLADAAMYRHKACEAGGLALNKEPSLAAVSASRG